jgi:hypothetical protein
VIIVGGFYWWDYPVTIGVLIGMDLDLVIGGMTGMGTGITGKSAV